MAGFPGGRVLDFRTFAAYRRWRGAASRAVDRANPHADSAHPAEIQSI